MFRNFLIVPWRNLKRNSLHSVINLFGLTVGLAACISIFTIIRFEYSFNKHHPDADRIYRIYTKYSGVNQSAMHGVPIPLAEYLQDNSTGFEEVVNFHTYAAKVEIPVADKSLKDLGFQFELIIAGPEYIDFVGQYELLAGAKGTLENSNTVVLVLSQAKKYFGDIAPGEMIGKTIIYNDSLVVEVGGIVGDIKYNSDFQFTEFLSYSTIKNSWLKEQYDQPWGNVASSTQLFVKLHEGTPVENLILQLDNASQRGKKESGSIDWTMTFHGQPLIDLHFNSEVSRNFDRSSHVADKKTLKSLSFITLAILIIAVINFINLQTAIAAKRSKEVGIRKVLGSSRGKLILHFLSESYIITFMAVVLAVPLVRLSLHLFNEYLPEGVSFHPFSISTFPIIIIAFALVGTLAGIYPAFLMSSFSPKDSIKDQLGTGKRKVFSSHLRKGLTVFQFGFSQVLIVLTIIAGVQIQFMLGKDLGFNTESIVYFWTPYYETASSRDVLKNQLKGTSDVEELAVFYHPPIQNGSSTFSIKFVGDDGQEYKTKVEQKGGDSTFIHFFGIDLVAGRNLRENAIFPETLINEACAKELGFRNPQEIIGKQILHRDTMTVVGVVEDFHFQSLHKSIMPLQISLSEDSRVFGVRFVNGTNSNESIERVEEAYKQVYPDENFRYYFMDNTKEQFYRSEQRELKLVTTATTIAIIISSLGLFGLASYITIQRTKEIGIRKVLGSTNQAIVMLLSKDFLKLVLIAFIVTGPIAYWLGRQWLADFAYRINIYPWIFIVTCVGSVLIAFLTVGYQSVNAANTNPADSLRHE